MFKVRVKDIQSFLEQRGYFWHGELKDGTIVNDELIDKILNSKVWLNDVCVGITPFKFLVFGAKVFGQEEQQNKDWSKEWINHLINTRGQEYAPELKKWCRTQKAMVRTNYAQERSLLLRRLEELRDEEHDELARLNSIAKQADIAESKHIV